MIKTTKNDPFAQIPCQYVMERTEREVGDVRQAAVDIGNCTATSLPLIEYDIINKLLLPKVVVLCATAVVITVCNGTLVMTILTHRQLRRKSHWFVLALACCDFTLGSVSVPLLILAETAVIAK